MICFKETGKGMSTLILTAHFKLRFKIGFTSTSLYGHKSDTYQSFSNIQDNNSSEEHIYVTNGHLCTTTTFSFNKQYTIFTPRPNFHVSVISFTLFDDEVTKLFIRISIIRYFAITFNF